MAVPPIAKATLQAALINAGSNVLAQGIKAYKNEVWSQDLVVSVAIFTCDMGVLGLQCISAGGHGSSSCSGLRTPG